MDRKWNFKCYKTTRSMLKHFFANRCFYLPTWALKTLAQNLELDVTIKTLIVRKIKPLSQKAAISRWKFLLSFVLVPSIRTITLNGILVYVILISSGTSFLFGDCLNYVWIQNKYISRWFVYNRNDGIWFLTSLLLAYFLIKQFAVQ